MRMQGGVLFAKNAKTCAFGNLHQFGSRIRFGAHKEVKNYPNSRFFA